MRDSRENEVMTEFSGSFFVNRYHCHKDLMLALLVVPIAFASAEGLPEDVGKFVFKREGCDHMRGEIPEPDQKARIRELNREIERLCKGTDKQLVNLRRKYAANLLVTERLAVFEPKIEARGKPEEQARQKELRHR